MLVSRVLRSLVTTMFNCSYAFACCSWSCVRRLVSCLVSGGFHVPAVWLARGRPRLPTPAVVSPCSEFGIEVSVPDVCICLASLCPFMLHAGAHVSRGSATWHIHFHINMIVSFTSCLLRATDKSLTGSRVPWMGFGGLSGHLRS